MTSDGLQHLLVVEDAFRSFSQVIKEISKTPLLVQLQRSAKINFEKTADSVIYYNHYELLMHVTCYQFFNVVVD